MLEGSREAQKKGGEGLWGPWSPWCELIHQSAVGSLLKSGTQGSVKQVAENSEHVLSLETMGPCQCGWANISVAAGQVLLAGSGEEPFLASPVSPAELYPLVCGPFPDLQRSLLPSSYCSLLLQLTLCPSYKDTAPG